MPEGNLIQPVAYCVSPAPEANDCICAPLVQSWQPSAELACWGNRPPPGCGEWSHEWGAPLPHSGAPHRCDSGRASHRTLKGQLVVPPYRSATEYNPHVSAYINSKQHFEKCRLSMESWWLGPTQMKKAALLSSCELNELFLYSITEPNKAFTLVGISGQTVWQ